jgi:transcription initiation factor TFIID subunit TAF12
MPLADLSLAWDALADSGQDEVLLRHASVMRGIVRCLVREPRGQEASSLDAISAISTMSRTVGSARFIPERFGPGLWSRLAPSPVSDPISRRVKEAFDPGNVLNPGIFGAIQ